MFKTYYFSIPSDPVRYFELVVNDSSPETTALTETITPMSSLLLPSTQDNAVVSEAPYLMLPAEYLKLFTSQYQGAVKMLAWNLGHFEMLKNITDAAKLLTTLIDLDTAIDNFVQSGKLLIEGGGIILTEALPLNGDIVSTEDGSDIVSAEDANTGENGNILLGSINPILDIIGDIVGLKRVVDFEPSNGISPIMDNETYLIALKAKIGANQWKGDHDGLQGLWKNIFPEGTIKITDNQDMTITVSVTGTFSSMINDLISHGYIVPKPEGVGSNLQVPAHPLFGFGMDNAYVSGFSIGQWS